MQRTDGHRNVTLSGDTRVDWSEAFALVPTAASEASGASASAASPRHSTSPGLSSIEAIRRLLEIAATDALSLETSIARVRAPISVAVSAGKLLETGELAEQLARIEGLVRREPSAGGEFG